MLNLMVLSGKVIGKIVLMHVYNNKWFDDEEKGNDM